MWRPARIASWRATRPGLSGAHWLSDGSGLLVVSDADGWFQVVRVSRDGASRTTLTAGLREHGEPAGAFGFSPLPSPDGRRFVHTAVHDGVVDLVVAPLEAAAPIKRGRGRPPKAARAAEAIGAGVKINPWEGVWRAVAWFPSGEAILAIGEGERAPQDLWILPVPGRAGAAAPAGHLLAPGGDRRPPLRERRAAPHCGPRWPCGWRRTLYRPTDATGRRGGRRVPVVIHGHGGPTWQTFRDFTPFRQLLAQEGMAVLSVDFRGSTGYGREFRWANRGEWGHADVFDMIDTARWAQSQPWCDGRLAIYGGSYGGYLTLCCLVEEPGLWRAGVDLYGDSEIAESYRHGDRPGRIDLQRMMGHPDDPAVSELFKRGSPVYRAERIEAPLLILHGRKDKRVVPLMSERMIEALEIEGKHHEVAWYDGGGPRLGAPREPSRRLPADPRLPSQAPP